MGHQNNKKTKEAEARLASDYSDLLAGILYNLEYAAYNLCDDIKYTDLPKGITDSTGPEESLLIAIRDLKAIAS
jgi:hypothetical protein